MLRDWAISLKHNAGANRGRRSCLIVKKTYLRRRAKCAIRGIRKKAHRKMREAKIYTIHIAQNAHKKNTHNK